MLYTHSLFLTPIPQDRYSCFHFTDKKTASERLNNFPKVTQLVSTTARTLLCVKSQNALWFLLVDLTLPAPGRHMPELGLGWVVSDLEELWIPWPTALQGSSPRPSAQSQPPMKPCKNTTYFCGYML